MISSKKFTTLDLGYARALIDLADEAGVYDEIIDEAVQIDQLLDIERDLDRLIGSRVVARADRGKLIETIFAGRVSDLMLRFIKVVNGKDRLDRLREIIAALVFLADERSGRIDVDAYVASELTDDQAADVARKIGASIDKTVILKQHVDEKLIGGLKIQIGDRLIDASIATQLKKLQNQIMAAGRARSAS